jgi:hypothetical protein
MCAFPPCHPALWRQTCTAHSTGTACCCNRRHTWRTPALPALTSTQQNLECMPQLVRLSLAHVHV